MGRRARGVRGLSRSSRAAVSLPRSAPQYGLLPIGLPWATDADGLAMLDMVRGGKGQGAQELYATARLSSIACRGRTLLECMECAAHCAGGHRRGRW